MNLSNSCIFHEFSVQMSYMALRGPSVRKGTLERHSSVGTVHSRRSQTRERVSVREQDPGEGEKPKKKGEGEKGKERGEKETERGEKEREERERERKGKERRD